MNKLVKVMLVAAVAAGGFAWFSGNKESAPDQKLVAHFDSLCDIARHHADKPLPGVKKTFGYMAKHSPDMMKQLGALFVEIEQIKDDRKHDKRAMLARKRFHKHGERCAEPVERFWTAVESDPKAKAYADRGFERFGRSIEIVFGADGLRDLYGPGASLLLPFAR